MAAGAAAPVDRARQFSDESDPRGSDCHAGFGHAALEGFEARRVADLLGQQAIALLHRPFKLADPDTIARIETGNQAVEKTPALGRWTREKAVQGRRNPNAARRADRAR